MSGSADFDPEDTRAEPMRIREQAQGFARIAGQLTGQQSSLRYVLRSMVESFSEVLHELIGDRIGDQFYTLQEVVGAVLYAEQVINGWAEDVVAFKQQRDLLVQRWESACANGFGVLAGANLEPEMRAEMYDSARRSTLTALNREADAAYTAFMVAAVDRGRQLREGPTVANLLGLMNSGNTAGPQLPILYPFLPVTGPRSELPRQYWGLTAAQIVRASEDNPELAATLVARVPSLFAHDPFEAALAHAVWTADGALPGGSGYGLASTEQTAEVAAFLAGIPPEELALLAALFPAVVGNLNGMPFEHRISANRIRIAAERDRAEAERAEAAAVAGADQPPLVGSEGGYDPGREAARVRAWELAAEIEQYELLLNEATIDYGSSDGPPWPEYRGRKILYFEPEGDGSWAELVGTINAETGSVGIFVPGVGTDRLDMFNQSNAASTFVEQAAGEGEQLAMIVWAGGDLPDDFLAAGNAGYARALVEPLVDFTVAVQQEIDGEAPEAEIPVTVIGHSYGGTTVALATMSGLSADQLVFVNSPGLGHEGVVPELEEYVSYTMDVPRDPTPALGPLVYWPPAITVDGVIDLETGSYADGTKIIGSAGHSGVFDVGSTAWDNILAVLTGRPVLVD